MLVRTLALKVHLLSTDLMIASQLQAAAGEHKVEVARSSEQLAEAAGDLVILDLDTRTYDLAELVNRLRSSDCRPRAILAFGPHVKTDLLEAATAAKCDEVMSRGTFHKNMQELLDKWATLDTSN